jgi:DNA-binding FadR family transcriptional regulator
MHQRIYRAIRDHDPERARTAMRDHLILAEKAQQSEAAESSDGMNSGQQ